MADLRALLIESPCQLSVDTGRLLLRRADGVTRTELAGELSVICFHHEQISISHHALRLLCQAGTALIVTDERHMPCGVLTAATEQASSVAVKRLHEQIAFDQQTVRKAQVWQALVRQKITNSAWVLEALGSKGHLRLTRLAQTVLPNDKGKAEGQAAKHFWAHYFALPQWAGANHKREKQGAEDVINIRLNYGYAIMRALIARQLAISGLNPILGLAHSNEHNPQHLADDLIEPYRAIIDWAVARLSDWDAPFVGSAKQHLLQQLMVSVTLSHDAERHRLNDAVAETVNSYVRCLSQTGVIKLKLPTTWRSESDEMIRAQDG